MTLTIYERELAADIQTDLGYFSAGTPVTVKARDWDGKRTIVLAGREHVVDASALRSTPVMPIRPADMGVQLRVAQSVLADLYVNASRDAQKRAEAKLGPRVLDWCVFTSDRRAP